MSQTTPQAIHLCHELLGWLIPLLDKFPRSRRFSLGDRLETALLDVLERLVEAAYTRANLKGQVVASLSKDGLVMQSTLIHWDCAERYYLTSYSEGPAWIIRWCFISDNFAACKQIGDLSERVNTSV